MNIKNILLIFAMMIYSTISPFVLAHHLHEHDHSNSHVHAHDGETCLVCIELAERCNIKSNENTDILLQKIDIKINIDKEKTIYREHKTLIELNIKLTE